MSAEINYSLPIDLQAAGVDPAKVEVLVALFHRQIAEGLHPAAQLVVLKAGQVLVDEAAGTARGKPVTPDTPFYVFSATKAITGVCVHRLIEQGKVDLDAPVAEYWPQFAKKGKGKITIRQVFLHLAGMPTAGLYAMIPLWPFWKLNMAYLASLAPQYEPGSQMGYHFVNYGFILGEVVRRVSGQPIEDFFWQQFAQPLGMAHSWLKIPADKLGESPRIISGVEEQRNLATLFNLRTIRRSVVPAASLHSTARDLARFYHMLVSGGTVGGKQYLQPETIRQATTLGYEGRDHTVDRYSLWAYGFHLGGRETTPEDGESIFTERSTAHTFGHVGNRSCMAWADHDQQVVVAFTCNRLLSDVGSRARWIDLNRAVWNVLD